MYRNKSTGNDWGKDKGEGRAARTKAKTHATLEAKAKARYGPEPIRQLCDVDWQECVVAKSCSSCLKYTNPDPNIGGGLSSGQNPNLTAADVRAYL